MGHGLGLTLVRTVAERHNGTVRVARSLLGGACFALELPALGAPDPASAG